MVERSMSSNEQIRRLQDAYPAIFLACHRRHLREDDGGNALTERQSGILDHLHATRPMTLSQLAEHIGVSRSTMSIAVARLVDRGYIHRTHGERDARSIELTLTPAGARVKEENSILEPLLVREIFKLMSPAELESSLKGVETLAKFAKILLRKRKREHDK